LPQFGGDTDKFSFSEINWHLVLAFWRQFLFSYSVLYKKLLDKASVFRINNAAVSVPYCWQIRYNILVLRCLVYTGGTIHVSAAPYG
jgi:hypothetical protein